MRVRVGSFGKRLIFFLFLSVPVLPDFLLVWSLSGVWRGIATTPRRRASKMWREHWSSKTSTTRTHTHTHTRTHIPKKKKKKRLKMGIHTWEGWVTHTPIWNADTHLCTVFTITRHFISRLTCVPVKPLFFFCFFLNVRGCKVCVRLCVCVCVCVGFAHLRVRELETTALSAPGVSCLFLLTSQFFHLLIVWVILLSSLRLTATSPFSTCPSHSATSPRRTVAPRRRRTRPWPRWEELCSFALWRLNLLRHVLKIAGSE